MEKYKLIENVCRYLVSVHNDRYESLRNRNIEPYDVLYDLEGKLIYKNKRLGYELEYSYDLSYPMVVCTGETVFKITDIGFQEKYI